MQKKKNALWHMLLGALFVCLAIFSPARAEEAPADAPRLRALLIGCDRFLTMENTSPAALQNTGMLRLVLQRDCRVYERITTEANTIGSMEALQRSVQTTFGDNTARDISLIYISTHSVRLSDAPGDFALLLSDGDTEVVLTKEELLSLLGDIRGTVILIPDSCNSGFLIGKGLDNPVQGNIFAGDRFHMLTSAGSDEISLYWRYYTKPVLGQAASFFCTALCSGLGLWGGHEADLDGDTRITLGEAERYISAACGTSLCRLYPENDDLVLFEYDLSDELAYEKTVSSVFFESDVLNIDSGTIRFSYLLNRATQIFYRVVYRKGGAWDFQNATYLADSDRDDLLSPGFVERELRLQRDDEESNGYILLQIYAMEGARPVLQYSHVLCVPGTEKGTLLSVEETASAFNPDRGEEMGIRVRYDSACVISARVIDTKRRTVCYLAADLPSRPAGVSPEGVWFSWNGKNARGEDVPSGLYTVEITAEFGQNTQYGATAPFILKR